MRLLFGVALLLTSATSGFAQSAYGTSNSKPPSPGLYGTGSNPSNQYVSPYTTNRGSTVPGHYQTTPNSTQTDNYGAKGNVNPYTGAIGTRTPKY